MWVKKIYDNICKKNKKCFLVHDLDEYDLVNNWTKFQTSSFGFFGVCITHKLLSTY